MGAFAAAAGCGSAWRWSLFGVWVLAALSPTAYSPAARGATIDVDVFNHSFTPGVVVINVGDTVVWTFRDAHAHNAVAFSGEFDSGVPKQIGTFTHTFTTPGSFPYICQVHRFMTGTVNVSEPAPTQPDLRISATSVNPGTVKTGSSYRIDATVINSGVATSRGTTLTYRLSTVSTISTAGPPADKPSHRCPNQYSRGGAFRGCHEARIEPIDDGPTHQATRPRDKESGVSRTTVPSLHWAPVRLTART